MLDVAIGLRSSLQRISADLLLNHTVRLLRYFSCSLETYSSESFSTGLRIQWPMASSLLMTAFIVRDAMGIESFA